MAYDQTKTNKTSKKIPEGTPNEAEWGFNNDGESKNTFGPSVKSTPNKVGGNDFASKRGKGDITGGIEDESIFGDIQYTGNTVNAGKQDYNSVDKSVWSGVDYPYDKDGQPGGGDSGVFGTPSYASGEKHAKVNGDIENSSTKYIGKPINKKRDLKVDGTFNGKNPTSDNVKISTNILTKSKG